MGEKCNYPLLFFSTVLCTTNQPTISQTPIIN